MKSADIADSLGIDYDEHKEPLVRRLQCVKDLDEFRAVVGSFIQVASNLEDFRRVWNESGQHAMEKAVANRLIALMKKNNARVHDELQTAYEMLLSAQ